MTKTFCDVCGVELTFGNRLWHVYMSVRDHKVSLPVTPTINSKCDADICKPCLLEAFKSAD